MRKTTTPEPPQMPEDFVQAHLPRHEPAEALRSLIASSPEDRGKSFEEYVGLFSAVADTRRSRPSNLLDLYDPDLRHIYSDAQLRPDHYDERQHEILNLLVLGAAASPPTDAEKNGLLLTFAKSSLPDAERERRAREQDRARRRREQEENDEIILEDGRTLSEVIEDEKHRNQYEGVFERQDFGDKVIV